MDDKNTFKCRCCGVEMRSKRPGSRQFFGGATDRPDFESPHMPGHMVSGKFMSERTLDALHSWSLGDEIDDPSRKFEPDAWTGWTADEDGPDHNFTSVYERDGKFHKGQAVKVRQENGRDLQIRVTIFDRKPETAKDAARRYLETIRDLTPQELQIHICYLTDGHDWELIEEGSLAGTHSFA